MKYELQRAFSVERFFSRTSQRRAINFQMEYVSSAPPGQRRSNVPKPWALDTNSFLLVLCLVHHHNCFGQYCWTAVRSSLFLIWLDVLLHDDLICSCSDFKVHCMEKCSGGSRGGDLGGDLGVRAHPPFDPC